MIARIWTGQTRAGDAEAYASYTARTGFPDYRSTPGNRGVLTLRMVEGDPATFTVITLWDSFHERVTHDDVLASPEAAR